MNAPFQPARLTSDQQQYMVLFRLEQYLYAVLIEQAQQVIDMVTITPIPKVTDSVAGMINFHGETVPVINLRRHLGLADLPPQLHTPIFLVTIQGRSFGLLVDEVLDVLAFSPDKMLSPKDVLPNEFDSAPMILGLIQTPQGMVILINLEHLFAARQADAIFEAAEAANQLDTKGTPSSAESQPEKPETASTTKQKPSKTAKNKQATESKKKTAPKNPTQGKSTTPEQKVQDG
jgi:purine-binding chemotaxis protein CheW